LLVTQWFSHHAAVVLTALLQGMHCFIVSSGFAPHPVLYRVVQVRLTVSVSGRYLLCVPNLQVAKCTLQWHCFQILSDYLQGATLCSAGTVYVVMA
jgi:hypothetical protein